MAEALRHRGPDDEGYLFVNTHTSNFLLAGGRDTPREVFSSDYPYSPKEVITDLSGESGYDLALANRRLAIIDLSPAGHQPMCNEDGTIWIVHNGEVYNFRELREELKPLGHRFVSDTDTEVIVHAYEEWGANCLNKFNGMWSFCIWDSKTRKLFCTRDRFGIKPFYYYLDEERFVFASEIKALLAGGIKAVPNYKALYDFLASGLTDHLEETAFKWIKALLPGHNLFLDLGTGEWTIHRYWDVEDAMNARDRASAEFSSAGILDLLSDAVWMRLRADVPIGSCLSGGLDSSAIVCLANELLQQGVAAFGTETQQHTFSARYADPHFDEGTYIQEALQPTGAIGHMTYPTAKGLLKNIEQLLLVQEKPFASTSVFAQWCVFRLAKGEGVKVTLDGQGGDELFLGYHSYFVPFLVELLQRLRVVRLFSEFASLKALYDYPTQRLLAQTVYWSLPEIIRSKLRSISKPLRHRYPWLRWEFVRAYHSAEAEERGPGLTLLEDAVRRQIIQTSIPSLLRYADRNSMAHSIESRVPFLDHRLVELALAVPPTFQIQRGVTKALLRKALVGVLPAPIRDRTDKVPFATPEGSWFLKEGRALLGSVVGSRSFRSRKYLDQGVIKDMVQSFLSGKTPWDPVLWRVLNVELWNRMFVD